MTPAAYIALAAALAVVLLATGWWRAALLPLRIKPETMTVSQLGLEVPAEHAPRIDSVLEAFAGGFNRMMCSPSPSAWERYCESLPPLCEPFGREGAAMGYSMRRPLRGSPADFERCMVRRSPAFCHLYYVGLGFWSAMRNHAPSRLARIVDELDGLHGFLCYDGFGFKHGFFDYPKDPASLGRLNALDGYARNAAYQGVGRALFFYFMGDTEDLIQRLDALGDHASDAAAGVGLAAVFIFHDRLDVAREAAAAMPEQWHEQVHLGMCFGLKARSINNPDQFERDSAHLDDAVQEAVRESLAECDRVESRLRDRGAADAYRCWRESVAEWMTGHVEYPLAGVRLRSEALYDQMATTWSGRSEG